MTVEDIEKNAGELKRQLTRFIDLQGEKGLLVNNSDWLSNLKYVDFLRDIGRHFSVNKMLSAEAYKSRIENDLSFIEFNYMLLQAYDFWYLFSHHDSCLQMGGNDQWGNILAGIELIRRLEGATAEGLTFPLITTSSGSKMGKTHQGSVWLDPKLTTPSDYYMFWLNQDDEDVGRFLALFTFLPMKEVKRLSSLKGKEFIKAKKMLAFEATRITHGEEETERAMRGASGSSISFVRSG
jgi:tyrosyl-tRNA synthetase